MDGLTLRRNRIVITDHVSVLHKAETFTFHFAFEVQEAQ
jgi:hypothetical protein